MNHTYLTRLSEDQKRTRIQWIVDELKRSEIIADDVFVDTRMFAMRSAQHVSTSSIGGSTSSIGGSTSSRGTGTSSDSGCASGTSSRGGSTSSRGGCGCGSSCSSSSSSSTRSGSGSNNSGTDSGSANSITSGSDSDNDSRIKYFLLKLLIIAELSKTYYYVNLSFFYMIFFIIYNYLSNIYYFIF